MSRELRKSENVNKLYESLKRPPEISHIENQKEEQADTLVRYIKNHKYQKMIIIKKMIFFGAPRFLP